MIKLIVLDNKTSQGMVTISILSLLTMMSPSYISLMDEIFINNFLN